MTTEKLIELAEYCTKRNFNSYSSCEDCPYDNKVLCQDMLLLDVAQRLDKAYEELKEQGYCSTCKYSKICSGDGDADTGCNGSDKWEWAGDEND